MELLRGPAGPSAEKMITFEMKLSLSNQFTPLFEVTLDPLSVTKVVMTPTHFLTISGGSTWYNVAISVINKLTSVTLLVPLEIIFSPNVNSKTLEFSFVRRNDTNAPVVLLVGLTGLYDNDQSFSMPGYATVVTSLIVDMITSIPQYDTVVMMNHNLSAKYLLDSTGSPIITIPSSTNTGFALYQANYPMWYVEFPGLSTVHLLKFIVSNDRGMIVGSNYTASISVPSYGNSTVLSVPYQGVFAHDAIVLIKFSFTGQAEWASRISTSQNEKSLNLTDIRVDFNGNLFVCGNSSQISTIAPANEVNLYAYSGAASLLLSLPTGCVGYENDNPFIVQFSSGGGFNSYLRLSSTANYSTRLNNMNVCNQIQSLYCCGNSTAQLLSYRSFAAVNSVFDTLNTLHYSDIIIAKFRKAGNTTGSEWIVRINSNYYDQMDQISSIESDATGNVYACVLIELVSPGRSTRILNPNASTVALDLTTNVLFAKLNLSGVCQWAVNITGTFEDTIKTATAISSNFVYIYLSSSSVTTFYNPFTPYEYSQSVVPTIDTTAGSTSVYLFCKFSTDGVLLWTSTITKNIIKIDILTSLDAFVYLVITFQNQIIIFDTYLNRIRLGLTGGGIIQTAVIQYDSAGTASVVGRITT